MGLTLRVRADLSIIGLSAIWGCSFVIIKAALGDISPMTLIAVRFCIAALPLWLLVPRSSLRPGDGSVPRGLLAGGLVTGALLFVGFTTQTIGIQFTTPARSAFITGMYIIFTPLLSIALGWKRPALSSFVGAILAVLGLFLLTSPGGSASGFGIGELLTLFCAAAFAAHLLAVDHYTRRFDRAALAFLQVGVTGVLAIPAMLFETVRFEPTARLGAALAVTSLVSTALAFYVLNAVQAWTTPTRAAIIFAVEPVFAAITSWAVEGEILTGMALLGAGLILAGMLVSELLGPPAAGAAAGAVETGETA